MTQEIKHFYPENPLQWREWLLKNHQTENGVWMIMYKKHTGKPSVKWTDAVDEALCFGWIDSKALTIDEDSFKQYYSPRNPKSTWSKINKAKIEKLIAENKMTQKGLEAIEMAKNNGSWTILDEVEELILPQILIDALGVELLAKFQSQSRSVQRLHLLNLVMAKTPATKEKRIDEIVKNLLK